jgi:hypothetical protein
MLGPEQEETAGIVTLRFGHRELTAPMTYSRVLNRGPAGVRRPAGRMIRGRVSAARTRTPRKMPRYVAVPRGVSLLTGQEAFRTVVKCQAQTGRDRTPSP